MMLDRQWLSPRFVFGIFIILLGLAFTFDNFGLPLGVTLRELLTKGWPLIFVLAGVARLLEARDPGSLIWVAVGAALLLHNFGYVDVRRLWPLGMVLGGVLLVWRAFVPCRAARVDTGDRLDALAFMGGSRRSLTTADFQGGSLLAVMGGIEIDLRGASIAAGQATLDAFAMWGGIEITVPRGWAVVNRGIPLLGGFEDSTQPPESSQAGAPPRLIITGLALMGGVEVKN